MTDERGAEDELEPQSREEALEVVRAAQRRPLRHKVLLGAVGLGSVAAAVGGFYIMVDRMLAGSGPPPSAVGAPATVTQPHGDPKLDSYMRDVTEQVNRQDRAIAAATGGSHVDVPTAAAVDVKPPPPPPPVFNDQNTAALAQASSQDERRQQQIDRMEQAMRDALAAVLSKNHAFRGGMTAVPVAERRALAAEQATQGPLASATAPAAVAAAPPSNVANTPIVAASHSAYGITAFESNSDALTPMKIDILSGPFSGGSAIADVAQEQNSLIFRGRAVEIAGRTYAADFVVVGPDDLSPALSTDVDRHLMERFLLPAAAAFVSGLGAAAAQPATTISVTGGSTLVTSPGTTVREQLFAGLGAGAQAVSEVAKSAGAAIRSTVKYRAKEPVGLVFLRAVREGDRQ